MSAHDMTKTPKCQWCGDRPGGCMMCLSPKVAAETSATKRPPEPPKPTPPLTNVADDTPEARETETDQPASAWDTSTDYGPREPRPSGKPDTVGSDNVEVVTEADLEKLAPLPAGMEPRDVITAVTDTGPTEAIPFDDANDEPSGNETPTRSTDPATSFAAAASVSESTILRTYRGILAILSRRPTTDEQMVAIFEQRAIGSPSGTRTRRSVLVDFGYVADTGETEVGDTNRSMTLWRITDAGRALLSEYEGVA